MPPNTAQHLSSTGNRRLLTILAADVVGYSRAVSEREDTSITLLSELRRIMDESILKHSGTIANTAGDSVIARFDSAVDAAKAAVDIQSAHDQYYETNAEPIVLRFRIGLNIGDVLVQKNGDLLGNGVNIAARLEGLADSGGICISSSVVEQIEGKIDFEFTKIGEHHLKNIAKPVVVYAVGSSGKSLASRIMLSAEKLLRRPLVLATTAALVVGSIAYLFWAVLGAKQDSTEGMHVAAFLETNPTAQEILEHFDLVTEGEFGGSKYYVIRTWGGQLGHLQRIAAILGGYMVAIGTHEENEYLFELTGKDEGHWLISEGQHNGPMIGLVQKKGAVEPDGGWYWMNGEPLVFEAWKPGGPENFGGNQSLAHFKTGMGRVPSSDWNDMGNVLQSFIVEVPK